MERDPLALTPAEMRKLGYRAVDLLVDWLGDPARPPIRRAERDELERLLGGAPPEEPCGPEALERLFRDVVPYAARIDHPSYLAFIPSSGTWPGALGDFVASALNVYAGTWLEGAGATQLELTVLDWFKDWVGFPRDADGQLTTGGSHANLQALACARELGVGAMQDDVVLYVSDQAHSSVARAARVLGFRPDRVRVLPTDATFRLRPETLAAAIDADLARGLTPLAAVASAGATNTGAVDPLAALAHVAGERGVWLHVDAAYGGFSVVTERGRTALAGLELADSLTMDPHKWLYQSYECGALLVREPGALRAAFEIVPPYLRDAHPEGGEVNFGDRGLQLSRTSRAFKVWLSIQTLGLGAFRAAIDRSLDLAEHAAARVAESASLELAAPPSLGIVCFRRVDSALGDLELDGLNARLVSELEASGLGFISSTTLRGRTCLRLCPLNHATERRHVDAVVDFLDTVVPTVPADRSGRRGRHDDVRDAWLARPPSAGGEAADRALLTTVPYFADLEPAALRELAALGEVRAVDAGTTLVRQWDATREFYVLLEGEVAVQGEDVARTLGRHDFFGEIGARDWGRGYGYARTATVVATTPVRLLVFAEGTFERALELAPALSVVVDRAVAERLPD